ncbi:MAG: hypothetical protein QNK40_03020, partial [Desulfobacterales bacterium]|nr:arylsulfatase [Bacteroides sp.]MDX2439497.1 hypothetical protein [Desulfobacterales bacterium]
VPFIVKWPAGVKPGMVSEQVICTTDLFRTFASLTGYNTGDDEGEDSYDISTLFSEPAPETPLREATVHHSINGSFAIRKGEWKLIMCPGSGGWSFPRPGRDAEELAKLPDIQLYNLTDDPGESNNLQAQEVEKVEELKALLISYIQEGRSTPGQPQFNDSISFKWKQVDFAQMD